MARETAQMQAEQDAGRPFLILHDCLPYGMPALMLINHNAMEILATPGGSPSWARATATGCAASTPMGARCRRIRT